MHSDFMTVLYKYYRALPKEYFNSPTIKLAQIALLNDPFEHYLPYEAVLASSKAIFKKPNSYQADFRRMFEKSYTFTKFSKGIISFSETHRNLLMWAHYANEHKGLCIGYKDDLISDLPLPTEYNIGVDQFKPKKVNYDKVMFDNNELPNHDTLSTQEYLNTILLKSLITKSDDWIYEKEHRCIVPLRWADEAIFEEIGNLLPLSIPSYKLLIQEGNVEIKKAQLIKIPDKYKFFIDDYSVDPGITLLKRINKKKISSVYFGCQMKKEVINDFVNIIKSNRENYPHIRLFRYERHKSKFELNIKEISI